MQINIHVTKKHIAEGGRRNCRDCPVALAVKDVIPGVVVQADLGQIIVDDVRYDTPEKVANFMNRFDDGSNSRQRMRSFRFVLSSAQSEKLVRGWYQRWQGPTTPPKENL